MKHAKGFWRITARTVLVVASAATTLILASIGFTLLADDVLHSAPASSKLSGATSPIYQKTSTQFTAAWGASPLSLVSYTSPAASTFLQKSPAARTDTTRGLRFNAAAMFRDFVPNNADGKTERAPFDKIDLPEMSSGARAIALLGENLETVANWYGHDAEQFKKLLLSDLSIHIDQKGRMLNIDAGVDEDHELANGLTASTSSVGSTISNAIYPLDQTFLLHSKPDSTRILYLNFKGMGTKPAFDLDKNVATFNTSEQILIQKIWARVKEDYAAFDVDITTESPASVTGKTGTSILITNEVNSAGGYAYLNAFGKIDVNNPPAFCFQNNLGNSEKPIAECISHELGHTLGLHHQSTSTATYYAGSGTGETAWAPIMGVSYYKNLTQWAKGEYEGASNKEDAYAVMAKRGLLPRTDDVGNTIASASNMGFTTTNGQNNWTSNGIIQSPSDVDMFRLTAGTGNLSLTIAASSFSGNLDASLQLFDADGKLLATSNTESTLGTKLTATISKVGIYYLSVSGAGKGDPKITGYSNYGSLGQYTITGNTPLNNIALPSPPVVKPK